MMSSRTDAGSISGLVVKNLTLSIGWLCRCLFGHNMVVGVLHGCGSLPLNLSLLVCVDG